MDVVAEEVVAEITVVDVGLKEITTITIGEEALIVVVGDIKIIIIIVTTTTTIEKVQALPFTI